MTVNVRLYAFVTYTGLVLVFCDILCAAGDMSASTEGEDYTYSAEMQAKIETIKRDILNKLGYKRPPNVTNVARNIEKKRRMIQEYRSHIEERERLYRDQFGDDPIGEENEEKQVESKTLYTMEYRGGRPEVVVPEDWDTDKAVRLYFPSYLSHPEDDHTRELHVHSAKLTLFIKEVRPENLRDTHSVDNQIRLNIYQIVSLKNSTSYKRTLLDSKIVPLHQAGFVNFEIGGAVQPWIDDPDSNLGLEVAADSQDLTEVVTIETAYRVNGTSGSSSKQPRKTSPSIQLYVAERDILKRVKRHTRRKNVCRRDGGETKCCRYPIKISFREIGWDSWIVAPQEYRGYYCAGECPAKYKEANTFAGIKSMLHMMQPDIIPSPCCMANKLSPFMILHYDEDGKYTFSKFKDLIVDQCRCG